MLHEHWSIKLRLWEQSISSELTSFLTQTIHFFPFGHLLFCTVLSYILVFFRKIIAIFLDSCRAQLAGISFIVHIFAHVAVVTIDPADVTVRAKRSYSSPTALFDRSKQTHVIQDQHCYLCDVKVYVFSNAI